MVAWSQNGYLANDVTRTKVWTIPGTDRKLRLHEGAPGALLVHFFAWFDKNVESIDGGQLDDWGFAVRPIRGQDVEYNADGEAINLSNHASGTAGDVNAPKHPLGVRNTFTDAQERRIRAKLKDYGGCIRWGGDYVRRADEMHFEIVRDEATCRAVLKRLTAPVQPSPEPEDPHPMSDLTAAEAALIGKAVADALAPKLEVLGARIDTVEQKYTVADNNYDSQRAAWTSVGNAYAAHLLQGGAAIPADRLDAVRDALWSYYRPLWDQQ